MRCSVSAVALLVAATNAVQVNFYWDRNCQQYADHRFIDPLKNQVVGGPYGSQSALYVNDDGLPNCAKLRLFCANSQCQGAQRVANIGQCVGDLTAIYAKPGCMI